MPRTGLPRWPIKCKYTISAEALKKRPYASEEKIKADAETRQCRNTACQGSVLCRWHGGERYAELRRRRYLLYCLTGNLELAMNGNSKKLEATLAAMILAMITENETGMSPEKVLQAASELLSLAAL